WAAGGRGTRTLLPAADITIRSLKPFGRSGVLFAAADATFGTLDSQGQTRVIRRPAIPDLRNKRGPAFTVSSDGLAVRFGLEWGGNKPVLFDLRRRVVQPDAPATSDLQPARTEAPGLTLKDWQNTTKPTLNGTPLSLDPYEPARSVAITPDGQE